MTKNQPTDIYPIPADVSTFETQLGAAQKTEGVDTQTPNGCYLMFHLEKRDWEDRRLDRLYGPGTYSLAGAYAMGWDSSDVAVFAWMLLGECNDNPLLGAHGTCAGRPFSGEPSKCSRARPGGKTWERLSALLQERRDADPEFKLPYASDHVHTPAEPKKLDIWEVAAKSRANPSRARERKTALQRERRARDRKS